MMCYCVEISDTKSQFNTFYYQSLTQQNVEKVVKRCEYFLKALYRLALPDSASPQLANPGTSTFLTLLYVI